MNERRSARVLDVTALLRATAWTGDWTLDRDLFAASGHGRELAVDKGVYVNYFHNDHDYPVHDRNGEKMGKGKLLVRPRLGTIKFGKFESGLLKRRSLDAHHMHRRSPGTTATYVDGRVPVFESAPETFAECLRAALVLDLSDYDSVSIVRAAESTIRKRVRLFLTEERLHVQDHRGDYRILMSEAPPDIVPRLERWTKSVFGEIRSTLTGSERDT